MRVKQYIILSRLFLDFIPLMKFMLVSTWHIITRSVVCILSVDTLLYLLLFLKKSIKLEKISAPNVALKINKTVEKVFILDYNRKHFIDGGLFNKFTIIRIVTRTEKVDSRGFKCDIDMHHYPLMLTSVSASMYVQIILLNVLLMNTCATTLSPIAIANNNIVIIS